MKLLITFVVAVSLVAACGKKKEGGDEAAKAAPGDKAQADKPADPPKPAGPVDAAQLAGTWTMADKPQITWTFNADGTTRIKTSVTEFPGTFELKGNALSMKGKDVAGVNEYVVVEVTAAKLRLKDANSSSITEFKK